jgi:hypothetical protein
MANGIDAIQVGAPVTATGGVSFADTTTALPTDAVTALTDFIKGGFIGEDGVTRTTDASDDKIRAWGGDAVKVVRTEHSISYTFAFLEGANAEVLRLLNGDENVEITPATASTGGQIRVLQTSKMPERRAYVLDMKDGDAKIREVIPNGQISTSGDVTFVHSDVIRYEVTIEAFPSTVEGTDGVKAVTYMDDGVFSGE